LKRARCRETYEEHATGKNTARPQLEACLKSLREGDTFVVWRLDRLGRNLADLVRLIAELETRQINFESLTEKIELGHQPESWSFMSSQRLLNSNVV
jgi:DNA invertase Pin-like site-specific DNA recombinase